MANYVGFLAARKARTPWNAREVGIDHKSGKLRMYCSKETHTWMQKAADLFGQGTDSIRWIATDASLRLDLDALEAAIEEDKRQGDIPFLLVANAGSVSTGVVDDLERAAEICKKHGLWYHIDGAYGGPAAGLPELGEVFRGMQEADSIALDPHKWFYAPLEAGCVLVRDATHLTDTFSYRPPYYHFEEYEETPGVNLYECGFQNSRGFRALKVWTGFLQAGRNGMQSMIRHDIAMAQFLFRLVSEAEDFEAFQTNLSITTFRYIPRKAGLSETQLNAFNEQVMVTMQNSGEAFVTNALIDGKFLLRACIVNFRTREEDIAALPGIIRKIGQNLLKEK
jgi:glutamate/tyrosine decarboxylase-like PLP-dependent enzyme